MVFETLLKGVVFSVILTVSRVLDYNTSHIGGITTHTHTPSWTKYRGRWSKTLLIRSAGTGTTYFPYLTLTITLIINHYSAPAKYKPWHTRSPWCNDSLGKDRSSLENALLLIIIRWRAWKEKIIACNDVFVWSVSIPNYTFVKWHLGGENKNTIKNPSGWRKVSEELI